MLYSSSPAHSLCGSQMRASISSSVMLYLARYACSCIQASFRKPKKGNKNNKDVAWHATHLDDLVGRVHTNCPQPELSGTFEVLPWPPCGQGHICGWLLEDNNTAVLRIVHVCCLQGCVYCSVPVLCICIIIVQPFPPRPGIPEPTQALSA